MSTNKQFKDVLSKFQVGTSRNYQLAKKISNIIIVNQLSGVVVSPTKYGIQISVKNVFLKQQVQRILSQEKYNTPVQWKIQS